MTKVFNSITKFFFPCSVHKESEKDIVHSNKNNYKRLSSHDSSNIKREIINLFNRNYYSSTFQRILPLESGYSYFQKLTRALLCFNFTSFKNRPKQIENGLLKPFSFFLIFLVFLGSCSKEPVETVFFDFENSPGVFITNEGNFMYGNASLSFYDFKKKRVYNHIFYARNKAPLGDVAQSMKIYKDKAYIVINNSSKIYVFDKNTVEFKGTISGLTSPRYIHFLNDQKAYVTDLYAKAISIVNPSTYKKIGSIDVNNHNADFYQHSTEHMLAFDNYVITNCWSYDNKILFIDTQSDQLVDSLEVPAQPNSMVIDKNNKLWVLTDGGFEGSPYAHERPALIRVNLSTREIEKQFRFQLDENPIELCINKTKDSLYFINRHVYRLNVDEASFPETPFVESDFEGVYGGFYGMAIDPLSSEVYIADALDYQQNGIIYRYSPTGELIDSFKAGVIPGSFCFKTE